MPGTCFKPNLPMAFRAFFSFRLWTATAEPAGMVASPSPAASGSESDELDASSAVVFLVGSSSGSSSILGFAMMVEWQCEGQEARPEPKCGLAEAAHDVKCRELLTVLRKQNMRLFRPSLLCSTWIDSWEPYRYTPGVGCCANGFCVPYLSKVLAMCIEAVYLKLGMIHIT